MRVLGVPGSLRRDSHNRRLLQAAAATLPPEAKLVIYDGLKAIPPFDEDDEHSPSRAVRDWREAIGDAGALLFATPEYNSSIPGQLKNAIDWASRPIADAALRNKPAAVIGASTGSFGAVWAQAELRKALAAAGARVIDRELPVALAHEAFDSDGALLDQERIIELDEIVAELLREAALSGAGSPVLVNR
ncbi:MAG: NAD(P)H-dependent oxidoreductase [Actinobacteria bacterium]|nr:MAG: NAD(P)H-dependent oxidoreductase [Actinomycetota bacterium]